MKFSIFYFLCIFVVFTMVAQVTVKGIIKDENGTIVAFASAALINATDSTLVRGSLTDENGEYQIENVPSGKYRILASFIGDDHVYSDIIDLKPDSKNATVDIFFLQNGILLDETVIVAKRPFLEQKPDRLVVNVASSAIAAGGTAMEILQKVPGVVILQDKVTLGGSQNLQVWVDGKPSPYTDMNALLRDMPGDQIEKIELAHAGRAVEGHHLGEVLEVGGLERVAEEVVARPGRDPPDLRALLVPLVSAPHARRRKPASRPHAAYAPRRGGRARPAHPARHRPRASARCRPLRFTMATKAQDTVPNLVKEGKLDEIFDRSAREKDTGSSSPGSRPTPT